METKFTFGLVIEETNYNAHIAYPLNFTEKNREESLNTASISLSRMTREEPFKPNKQVKLKIFADDVLYKSYPMMIVNGVSNEMGQSNLFHHKINLIEYTYRLEKVILPDTTITRLQGVYEPSLFDVARIILNRATELTGEVYEIEPTTWKVLQGLPSPEWTFNRFTALEALRMVFSMAKIVPTMTEFDMLGHVSMFEADIGEIEPYTQRHSAYDGETYNTALFSNVENLVIGKDNPITEPSNGWMTPRSDTGFEISNNHAMLQTSKPIYKIHDLRVFFQLNWIYNTGAALVEDEILPYDIIPKHFYKNSLLDYVFEKQLYDLLPNTQSGEEDEKGRALYYEQSKPGIFGLTHVAERPGFWTPLNQTIKHILENLFEGTAPAHEKLQYFIKPEYLDEARQILEDLGYVETNDPQSLGYPFSGYLGFRASLEKDTIPNIRFQIEYTPLYNSDLFTYRERQLEEETKTFQFHNQQASVIDSSVLAEIHDKIIQRGSGIGKSLIYLHRKHTSIIPSGSRYKEYLFTSADYTYGKYGVKVIYNLDEYHAKLQKHVAILEQHRQFSIPNENIVTRQMTHSIFANIEEQPENHSSGVFFDYSDFIGNCEDVEINYALFPQKNIVISAARYPFNNSLVFQAEMEGNVSAGNRSVAFESVRSNEPVPYTDSNGRLNGSLIVYLGKDLQPLTLEQIQDLPKYDLGLVKNINYKSFRADKDAREKLKFMFQLHHIDKTGYVYINKWLAKQNGLVGGEGLTTNLKYVLLNTKPYERDIIDYSTDVISMTDANIIELEESIILPTILNNTIYTSKSHALVKHDGRVLYWVNEEVAPSQTSKQLYINFKAQGIVYIGAIEDSFGFTHEIVAQMGPFYEGALTDNSFALTHSIATQYGVFRVYDDQEIEDSFAFTHQLPAQYGVFRLYDDQVIEDSFAFTSAHSSVDGKYDFYEDQKIEDSFAFTSAYSSIYGKYNFYEDQKIEDSFAFTSAHNGNLE